IEHKSPVTDRPLSLKDANQNLGFTRKMGIAADLHAQGIPAVQAGQMANQGQAHDTPPRNIHLVNDKGQPLEALDPTKPVSRDKALNIRQATRMQAHFRETQAAQQAELMRQIESDRAEAEAFRTRPAQPAQPVSQASPMRQAPAQQAPTPEQQQI